MNGTDQYLGGQMNVIGTVALGLLVGPALNAATRGVVKETRQLPPYQVAGPAEEAAWAHGRFLPPRPLPPRRDDVIGDQFEAGDTYYDYQTNGSVGKMIGLDSQGGIHVTWMDGYTVNNDGTRQQKFNYRIDDAWLQDGDVAVVQSTRSGYGSIWLTNEDEQRALVFCHATGILQRLVSVTCIDFGRGWGAFDRVLMPNYPDVSVAWPQGVLSPEGRIHVVYNREGADGLSYTRANFNEGAPQFPDVPVEIGRTSLNTFRIAQSPVSERAAVTWITSRLGIPAPDGWVDQFAYQVNNDLWLAWTDDGEHWNFDAPLNVTNCIPPDPNLEGDEAYGDTLRPFCTHDVIFDADDQIHIVFEALGMWEKPIWNPGDAGNPWDGVTSDASFLFHWTEEDCTITPVADGWFNQAVYDENDTLVIWPSPGSWKSNACNPSLAYDEDGNLYCTFNYYPYGDYNDYINIGNAPYAGRCHGDVAVTVSENNGRTWFYPTMLTTTRSPLAQVGEAMCEEYPTQSERVDDNLHISYELDREAGTILQRADAGASNTLNPFYYLRTPVELVARDSIWHGPSFHIGEEQAVRADAHLTPAGFRLSGVYPNPFNSSAQIEFDVRAQGDVELAVYDLDGRLARKLFAGLVLPGHHRVALEGVGLPAGVYVVRLSGSGSNDVMKAALVK